MSFRFIRKGQKDPRTLMGGRLFLPTGGGAPDPLYVLAGSVPTLDLYFSKNKSLVDDISGNNLTSFTRASSGTYLDSDGLIKTEVANQPRFEHDLAGNCLGLLQEDTSANYVLDSEDFSTAKWTLSGASLSTNAAVAPDGTSTADKLIASGPPGTLQNRVFQQINTGGYTRSVFAKAAEADEILIRTADGFTSGSYVVFSLINGSIVSQGGAAPLNIYVKQYPNGWWRFGVADNNVSLIYFAVFGANCQAGNGIYIWGANATTGVGNFRMLTSYIPTGAVTTTRAADSLTITGANFSSWYDNVNRIGTDYMAFNQRNANCAWAVREKTGNQNTVEFRNGFATVVTGNSIQAQFNLFTPTFDASRKWTMAFQDNNFAGVADGGTVLTDVSGTVPSVSGLYFEEQVGVVGRYAYWPSRIPNANIQAMTVP